MSARGLAALCTGLLAVVVLTGCGDDTNTPDGDASTSAAPTAEDSAATPSDEGTAAVEPTDADTDHSGEVPADLPDGLPEGMPNIGLPYYTPAELVAIPSVGGPWVLEFITNDDLTRVNSVIADKFSAAQGWADLTRQQDGSQTVTQGTRDGFLLVIAVAPSRGDSTQTSLYYTLSQE